MDAPVDDRCNTVGDLFLTKPTQRLKATKFKKTFLKTQVNRQIEKRMVQTNETSWKTADPGDLSFVISINVNTIMVIITT